MVHHVVAGVMGYGTSLVGQELLTTHGQGAATCGHMAIPAAKTHRSSYVHAHYVCSDSAGMTLERFCYVIILDNID